LRYLMRRILVSIAIMVAIINFDFIIPRLVPGNAAEILAASSRLPQQAFVEIQARLGLDHSYYVQYVLYLKGIFLSWPPYFGVSYQYFPAQVTTLFFSRLPWTLILIGSSFALSIIIAYFMSAYASSRRAGKFEVGSLYSAIVFHATPVFWTSMILLWVFAVYLRWLPIFGNISNNPGTGLAYLGSVIVHAILPVLAMTLSFFGEVYLVLRGTTQQVLKTDYVTAARTRGLSDFLIARRYILRNSLLPLVSLLTFSLASLISRVILVESVFGYAGIGDLIVDAVVNRDYPVLEGSIFYVTLLVVIGGLIGDFLLVRLDPKLREEDEVRQ